MSNSKRQEMLNNIARYVNKNGNPYTFIKVTGGTVPIEQADTKYIAALNWRLMKDGVLKENFKPKTEVQLEFKF